MKNKRSNKWATATAVIMIFKGLIACSSSWAETTNQMEPSKEISVAPTTTDLVCVAYGKLISIDNSRLFPNAPPEAQIDDAVFQINEVARGKLDSKQIRVRYCTSSLRTTLPENAILILSSVSSYEATYEVIGKEAWRGILPDTPENRSRISAMSSEEISQTPRGKELPEATARQIAQQALADHADYTGYSGEYKLSTIKRLPFGWFFGIYVLDKRGQIPFVRDLTLQVNDEGEVVSFKHSLFGSSWSASEWDAIPAL